MVFGDFCGKSVEIWNTGQVKKHANFPIFFPWQVATGNPGSNAVADDGDVEDAKKSQIIASPRKLAHQLKAQIL